MFQEYLSGSATTDKFPPYNESIWRAVSFYIVNKCSQNILLSLRHSPSKQVNPTSPLQVSNDFVIIKN